MEDSTWLELAKYVGMGFAAVILLFIRGFIPQLEHQFNKLFKRQPGKADSADKDPFLLGLKLQHAIDQRIDYGQHDLKCGRLLAVWLHNGGKFLSTQQVFKLSTVSEKCGAANSMKHVVQQTPIHLWLPLLYPMFEEGECKGVHKITVLDPDERQHELFQIVEDELEESWIKTVMIDNCIYASYCALLRDVDGGFFGFIWAHYMDEKYDNPLNVPTDLYYLAHLAYNISSDIIQDKASRSGVRYITRINTGSFRRQKEDDNGLDR